MKERLVKALFRPQVIVAFLLLVAALALLLSTPRLEPAERMTIDLRAPRPSLSEQEATLVLVDEVGEERARTVTLQLPEGEAARMAALFEELRRLSMEQGVWPADLPVPRLFLTGSGRGATLVVDVLTPVPVGVSVEQERAILRSLTATALRNGASEVRFLREGRPTETLLGHVAVPSTL